MKFRKISIGILIVLSHKELDGPEILKSMKAITGREISDSALFTCLVQLLKTELITARTDRSAGLFGGMVEYYVITKSGRYISKSIRTGLFRRGRVG